MGYFKLRQWQEPDTSEASTTISRLITSGTSTFPNVNLTELSQALHVAQAEAERKALRPH